jgi:uncharacterized secreted protein with C-terminal beta-propeller domain
MFAVHAAANGDVLQGSERIRDRVDEVSARCKAALNGIVFAESYADVFSALRTAQTAGYGGEYMYAVDERDSAEAAVPAEGPAPSADPNSGKAGTENGGDYSETNAQVAGIDEGDIVKTDGTYIYVLHNFELIIYKAAGSETVEISRTAVGKDWTESGDGRVYDEKYPSELYIYGDRLAVLSTRYSGPLYKSDGGAEAEKEAVSAYWYPRSSYFCLDVYDISDPAHPALKSSLGQDGYNLASRMKDGLVYAVSNYYVYSEPDENDPGTYVPCLYRDSAASPMAVGDISIMPKVDSASYTVIAVYDMESGTISLSQSVLGGGSMVYMNHDNLYVAGYTYDDGAGEPYTDGIYTVVEYNNTVNTQFTRFSIKDNGLYLAAAGSIPGSLNNQFSMDEYDGHLRVVSTKTVNSYKIYTDEEHGWSNYLWDEDGSKSSNALYILDADLHVAGSVTDLAEDEFIYSARFDGDIGYFVTFRQTDPLFAVDLSNPEAPAVLSALKIPGFSEYLHLWSDGRLFGLGRDADVETGRAGGMKLSMFDTSDPANVTELKTLLLETSYSAALYNHKAILISLDKNLIGFPTETGYAVYGYSDDGGFQKKAEIECGEWSGNARGLYVGDCLYIVDTTGITVIDMNTFRILIKLTMDQ